MRSAQLVEANQVSSDGGEKHTWPTHEIIIETKYIRMLIYVVLFQNQFFSYLLMRSEVHTVGDPDKIEACQFTCTDDVNASLFVNSASHDAHHWWCKCTPICEQCITWSGHSKYDQLTAAMATQWADHFIWPTIKMNNNTLMLRIHSLKRPGKVTFDKKGGKNGPKRWGVEKWDEDKGSGKQECVLAALVIWSNYIWPRGQNMLENVVL